MDDYQLTNTELEDRVAELFSLAGFNVSAGRPNKEDLLFEPPDDWVPQIPMAVEVKSTIVEHKKRLLTEHLRQLDDRIFELSGEKEIRGRTLTQWKNPVLVEGHIGPPGLGVKFIETRGALPYSPVHPIPYKGILVFNGPTTTPFDKRLIDWLGDEQKQFAEARSFCVMSLKTLLDWVEACDSNGDLRETFWRVLHETFGRCPDPPT